MPKYIFNPSPKIVFEDYDEYVDFRNKVDSAIVRLGFKSHVEFLRNLYLALKSMMDEIEEENTKKEVVVATLNFAKRKLKMRDCKIIAGLKGRGLSWKEIAELYELSDVTVRNFFRQFCREYEGIVWQSGIQVPVEQQVEGGSYG